MLAGSFAIIFGSIPWAIGAGIKWLNKPEEIIEENEPSSSEQTNNPNTEGAEDNGDEIVELPKSSEADENGIVLNDGEVEVEGEYPRYPQMFWDESPTEGLKDGIVQDPQDHVLEPQKLTNLDEQLRKILLAVHVTAALVIRATREPRNLNFR